MCHFEGNNQLRLSLLLQSLICFLLIAQVNGQSQGSSQGPITIVIHGGAGTLLRENMSQEVEMAYTGKLMEAVETGYQILENGGTSVEAVTASVRILEDSPLFNAGKGAVFTNEGKNELDASIMDGATLAAGAVAGVTTIKNPIEAARAVMLNSRHVFLSGRGAEKFAEQNGLEIVDSSWFYTEYRHKSLKEILKEDNGGSGLPADRKYGTVGVLALDIYGNLAAGTSTGGMTNKKFGRIGDTPVIGAGTYADNRTCAVSSTGHGEYFIRKVVAYDIAAKVRYTGMTLQEACEKVIYEELPALGGSGGVIALDRDGNISMVFNTEGMYRAYRQKGMETRVAIFK
jgi:L-asparaginase / beta-aspartyl-peptidase